MAGTEYDAGADEGDMPQIVRTDGVLGGDPRIGVYHVYQQYVEDDRSPDEIATAYSISVAEVHAALTYAFDNPDAIRTIEKRRRDAEERSAGERIVPDDARPSMDFLADENVESEGVDALRAMATTSNESSTSTNWVSARPTTLYSPWRRTRNAFFSQPTSRTSVNRRSPITQTSSSSRTGRYLAGIYVERSDGSSDGIRLRPGPIAYVSDWL